MRMSVKMDHSGQLQAVSIYPKIMARPPKLRLTAHILLKVTGMTVKRPLIFAKAPTMLTREILLDMEADHSQLSRIYEKKHKTKHTHKKKHVVVLRYYHFRIWHYAQLRTA